MSGRVRWSVVGLALIAALAPVPASLVERWYSRGVYPPLQRALTTTSNIVPFAIFDVLLIAAVPVVVLGVRRNIRAEGWLAGAARSGVQAVTLAAIVYLVFLASWGLNYRRTPLAEQLAFDQERVNGPAVEALVRRAVSELNAFHDAAHSRELPIAQLGNAFDEARAVLRPGVPTVHGRPKQTLLGGYFHQAGISGMTDPFLLETLIAPDLLDVERPFVVAHEWAHLAGYADESEANFVAWLACARAGDAGRYSAWLALLGYLPLSRESMLPLKGGPRSDLLAIRYRYQRTSRVMRAAAQASYDRYLKANRVSAGVGSYDLVIELILGTAYDAAGNPVLR